MQPRPTQLELRNLQIAKIKTLYVNRVLPMMPYVIEIGTNGVNVVGPIYINGGALPIPSINTANNFALGIGALSSLTTGLYNVAVGPLTLTKITTTARNVAIGISALQNTTGGSNTAIGASAMQFTIGGNANIALGDGALIGNEGSSSYSSNIAVGFGALGFADTGGSNIVVGANSCGNITTAINNIIIGTVCASFLDTGNYNVAVGADSFFRNIANLHFAAAGYGAARFCRIDGGIAIGSGALAANISGIECTAIGRDALAFGTTLNSCTGVGFNALRNCTGDFNTGIGNLALFFVTTGSLNTTIGSSADVFSNAIECVAIGANATALANYDVQCGAGVSQASGALYYRLQRVCDAAWNDANNGLMVVGGDGAFAKSRALTPGFERFTLTGNSVQNPSIDVASTFITTNASVAGATPVGTLANGTTDGQIKTVTLSAQSGGVNYVLTVTNGVKTDGTAITTITFNSAGQTVELIWDNSAGKWYVLKATATFA